MTVNKLNITFKKLILFSALTVILGASLVFAMRYEFTPENMKQTLPTSTGSHSTGGGTVQEVIAHIIVFAYSGDAGGFIQASVMVEGPASPITVPTIFVGNGSVTDETFVNETLNGTTTTNLQDPLSFTVIPGGVYSIVGTYGSATAKSATVNVTERDSYSEVVLNFGSSLPPPLGHIIVAATYFHPGTIPGPLPFLEYLNASITITGPETLNGMTSTDEWNPTLFTVLPGVYSVFATYGSATQNATVNVTAGSFVRVPFDFSP